MNETSIQTTVRVREKSLAPSLVLVLKVCGFVAGLVLATSVAAADPAREHFEQGRKLLKQGKAKAACEAFQKSIDIAPTNVGVFLNLGDCNQKQQKFASAVVAFTEASRLAAMKGDKIRLVLAEQRLAAVASRLSTIKVLMPGELSNRDDVAVLLDDRPLVGTSLAAPIPVDIGKHVLVVNVGDEEYFAKDVELTSEKEMVTVEVPAQKEAGDRSLSSDGKDPSGTDPSSTSSDLVGNSDTKPRGPIVWSLLGVAVVGAGVGTYLGLNARSRWKDADSCSATQCTQDDADLAASARLRGHLSTGLFALSAVSVGVGAWLYFSDRSSGQEREGVEVVVGPTSIGVVGRF